MSRLALSLGLILVLLSTPVARADWLNGLMRELGLAWSDGYHAYSTCPRCPQPPTIVEADGPHFPLRPVTSAAPRYPTPAARERVPTPAPRPQPAPQPEGTDSALPPGVTQAPELTPPRSPLRTAPWDDKAARPSPGAAYFEAARRAALPR